jgi:hypothetical protein
MATKPNTPATDSPPEASQISGELTAALASADSMAAERVQNLQWVHQARVSQLSRTAASLKDQYGADDPGVKAAEAAAAAANVTAATISMVHQQLTTVDPEVAPKGWALHGRVVSAEHKPASGFTVFLVDATNTFQKSYGFAYTDYTGYFVLKYAGPDSASTEKSQAASDAARTQLFIAIANKKALLVHRGTTEFQPTEGAATYKNIILPGSEQAIGDLPPEIRDVALPARKDKKKT